LGIVDELATGSSACDGDHQEIPACAFLEKRAEVADAVLSG
jgi:hypothetical protein